MNNNYFYGSGSCKKDCNKRHHLLCMAYGIIFAIIAFACAGCAGHGTNNSSDSTLQNQEMTATIAGSESQDAKSDLSDSEVAEIKDYVKSIWFRLPPITHNIESVSNIVTDSFYSVLSKCNDKYESVDSEHVNDTVELAEVMYGWWGAQEPNPDGEFLNISLVGASGNKADVKVVYKNWDDVETHILYLKKENGKWLLDNFDNVKNNIEECLKEFQN